MQLLALLPALASLTLALENLPFPEGQISWHGPVDDSGHNVTLLGKHGEIAGHLHSLNPSWMNKTKAARDVHDEEETVLEKRGRVSYMCNQPVFGYARTQAIFNGITYIQQHMGGGTCGVAPYSCGRFSCAQNSAILMCNAGGSWTYTPCMTLAQNANFVVGACKHIGDSTNLDQWAAGNLVEGQAFYENPTYNVLIKQTDAGKGC